MDIYRNIWEEYMEAMGHQLLKLDIFRKGDAQIL